MRLALALAAMLTANSATAQKMGKAEKAAIAATPEQIAASLPVQNDSLDTSIKISTESFYTLKQGLFGLAQSDKFARAFIDKKSGAATFQIYVWITYSGEWVFYDRANYETPSGPVATPTISIDRQVLACTRYGCAKSEHVAFTVPEETLRAVSSGATGGDGQTWHFKIAGRGGDTGPTELLKTEIAGLLLAVDRERRALAPKP